MINNCKSCNKVFYGYKICKKCRLIKKNKDFIFSKFYNIDEEKHICLKNIISKLFEVIRIINNKNYKIKLLLIMFPLYLETLKTYENLYDLDEIYFNVIKVLIEKINYFIIELNNEDIKSFIELEYFMEFYKIAQEIGIQKDLNFIFENFDKIENNKNLNNYEKKELQNNNYKNLKNILKNLKYPYLFYYKGNLEEIIINYPKIYSYLLENFNINKEYFIDRIVYILKFYTNIEKKNNLIYSIYKYEINNEKPKIYLFEILINKSFCELNILNYINYFINIDPFFCYELYNILNNENNNYIENYLLKNKENNEIINKYIQFLELIVLNKLGENELKEAIKYSILIKNMDLLLKYILCFNYSKNYDLPLNFENIE